MKFHVNTVLSAYIEAFLLVKIIIKLFCNMKNQYTAFFAAKNHYITVFMFKNHYNIAVLQPKIGIKI